MVVNEGEGGIPKNLIFCVPLFLGTPGKQHQYGGSLSVTGQYNVYLKTSPNTWDHLVDSVDWPVVSLALDHPIIPLSLSMDDQIIQLSLSMDDPIIPLSPSQDDPIIPVPSSLPLPAQLGGDDTDFPPTRYYLLGDQRISRIYQLSSNIEGVWIM